ncbi:hypothetical protein [Rhodanobacter lindaniclasticus]
MNPAQRADPRITRCVGAAHSPASSRWYGVALSCYPAAVVSPAGSRAPTRMRRSLRGAAAFFHASDQQRQPRRHRLQGLDYHFLDLDSGDAGWPIAELCDDRQRRC